LPSFIECDFDRAAIRDGCLHAIRIRAENHDDDLRIQFNGCANSVVGKRFSREEMKLLASSESRRSACCEHDARYVARRHSDSGFRLDGHTRFFPGMPPANEGARLEPPCLSQQERRTGARGFVNSGTVDNERRALRQAQRGCISDWIVRIDTDCTGSLCIRVAPVSLGARVEENHIASSSLKLSHLVDGDSIIGIDRLFDDRQWFRGRPDRRDILRRSGYVTPPEINRYACTVDDDRAQHDKTRYREKRRGTGNPCEYRKKSEKQRAEPARPE
jgi:hypothetical protein